MAVIVAAQLAVAQAEKAEGVPDDADSSIPTDTPTLSSHTGEQVNVTTIIDCDTIEAESEGTLLAVRYTGAGSQDGVVPLHL